MDRFRDSIDALRRGEPVPEDGYHGEYVAELARARRRPGPADARVDRADDGALPHPLRQLGAAERARAAAAPSSCRGSTRTSRTARSGRGRRPTATSRTGCSIRSADKGGTPTYRAADVAYLVDKLERGFDRAIYVLGADHHATARWYAAIARMLGYDPERVEVLLYQFVHLTRGGESTKASKRAGNVVFLDDVMDEIGVDAARWYLVNRGPDQTIEIDLDLAAEKSQKNPVYYVQYAHARIAAILRNARRRADRRRCRPGRSPPEEKELIKRLTDFPPTVREAPDRRGPQLLPSYAIRLADDFHRFYHECRVLGDPAQAFRLGLCRATQRVIARSLDLVGVEAPDRM